MSEIRAAGLRDHPGAYRVCHETGSPGAGQNPDLLGHVYVGAYLANQADLARVIVDPLGVAGYLFGCDDTRAFEAWCEREWWPPLRAQYPLEGAAPVDADLIGQVHSPSRAPDAVVADFPAHLHIDFLERARGHGHGRVLIEWLCSELAGRGVPGIHLGVGLDNDNAIEFYAHLGFTTLESNEQARWMVRSL